MELASKYNPAEVEGKWYQYWLDNKLFSSKPDGREVITDLEPDILECEVKWALESITMNKASGGDGIQLSYFKS